MMDASTRPSIFLRIKQADSAPREIAWRQFYDHYAPIIAAFARARGANRQQGEEIVQDVIGGFFAASPRFVYDPARGRFRAYLKTCAVHALSRLRAAAPPAAVPIEELAVVDDRDEQLWDRLWRDQVLRRATAIAREHYARNGKLQTFLAFEQNVVFGRPAADVAVALGISPASVHTAKSRVTEKLREICAGIEEDEG